MQNTWSIDRTWTPRKGRSRPALMVEDNTTPAPVRGGGINPTAKHMPAAMNTNTHRRSKHETRVHHPVPKPPGDPDPAGSAELKIRGGHGLGETPGPIPNPEAKTQHGNGTAPGRVWESSTPPPLNVIKGGISRTISFEMPPFFISATDLGLKIHAFSQSHIPSK